MKLLNKTIYIFSLFKTYRIYFGIEDEDRYYKSNRLEVIIYDSKTIWINCLLKMEGYNDYEYFSFEGYPALTKENFLLNSISLYKINIEKNNKKQKDYSCWKPLL